MEEYHDLLKSTEAWIERTSRLLANPADYDSSNVLSHRASTLQVSVISVFPACHRIHILISALADHHGPLLPFFPEKQPCLQAKWQKEAWESGRLWTGNLETRI